MAHCYSITFLSVLTLPKKIIIGHYDEKNMGGRSVISCFYRKAERNITIKECIIFKSHGKGNSKQVCDKPEEKSLH